ncbi:hypothetical protein ACQZV8_10400 [Magnetococcales bacterium HHB-1]
MESKFCDGVANISIKSGVVRVDFFETRPDSDADLSDGKAPEEKKKLNHRLLLSPESFIQTHTAFQQVVDELMKKGVIKKKEGA